MLEQISNAIKFYAFYTNAGEGATGLTVTVDVYNPAGTEVVSAGSATALGDGIYYYSLASGSTGNEGEYIAIFKTSGTVDQKHIPALWVLGKAGIEHLDADVADCATATALQTVDDNVDAIKADTDAYLDAAVSSRLASASYTAPDNTGIDTLENRLTATRAGYLDNLTNLDAAVSSRLPTASYSAPPSSATIADAVLDEALSGHVTAGTSGKKLNDLDTSLLATAANLQTIDDLIDTLISRLTAARAGYLDKLNVSGTLAHSDAAATYKADVSALATAANLAIVDGIVDTILTRTDVATSTRLATSGYTAPDNAGITSISGKVDTILIDTNELQTNQGNWLTATGFATASELTLIDGKIDLIAVDTANLMSTVEPYGDGYIFTEIALQNAPVTTPSADVNVISVNGVSVTSVNDFKATGFSTFDPAVDLVKIGTNYDKTGYALANPDLCKADLTTAEANLATLLARISATRAGYLDYIDDNYTNINTLLTRLTELRAAKLDNVSQFDAATDVVYANIDLSDLELDLNIALIHEAFNTYPDSLPPGVNPPVVLPPDNTDAVKIYAYCFSKDSNTILTDCNGTLELLLSTEENGKHHKADPEAGTYYDDTGELFWLVPPYAKVRVQIPALKIDVIGYTGAGAETLRVDHLYKTPQVPV